MGTYDVTLRYNGGGTFDVNLSADPRIKPLEETIGQVKDELAKEKKEKNQLEKVIERMSEVMREETHYNERLLRIIDYLCGKRRFTSNVEQG